MATQTTYCILSSTKNRRRSWPDKFPYWSHSISFDAIITHFHCCQLNHLLFRLLSSRTHLVTLACTTNSPGRRGAAANWNLFRWRRNEWMNDSRQANENKRQNQIFCCYGWEWETDVNKGPCTINMKWKNLEFRHDMLIKRITRYIVGSSYSRAWWRH